MVSASVPGYKLDTCSPARIRLITLTRVVSTANSNFFTEVVLDVHTTDTLDAKVLREVGVCEVKLSIVLAVKATNGLASSALSGGPLGLLVAGRAGIGAHGTRVALVTSDSSLDVLDKVIPQSDVLDTGVATETEVVKGNSTILRGEVTAVDLAIRELTVQALATRGAARARGRGRSGSRVCGRSG